jgi:hypothetical protein
MSGRRMFLVGLLCSALSVSAAQARAESDDPPGATGLVREVREATAIYRDVAAAVGAGWMSTDSCVSGPQEGAMGVHFANGPLIEDGVLDARQPELLIYEQRGSRLRLVGVEFLVIAEAWHAHTTAPPVLMGQQFHYVGSPNRYGLPAFYELHVWAWRNNPNGEFVDWNPAVSCAEYVPDQASATAGGHRH